VDKKSVYNPGLVQAGIWQRIPLPVARQAVDIIYQGFFLGFLPGKIQIKMYQHKTYIQ